MDSTFADLQADWSNQFPGDTYLLKILRGILIDSDWRRLQARSRLDHLYSELELTGLPPNYWDARTYRYIHLVERRHALAQTGFLRSLKTLQVTQAAQKPALPAPLPVPSPEPPKPPPPPKKETMLLPQSAEIKIVDGKVVTRILDLTAARALEVVEERHLIVRQLCFVDAIVPDIYKWVLSENGVEKQPTSMILIYLGHQAFLDVCRKEIETGSEHLLEPERCYSIRRR